MSINPTTITPYQSFFLTLCFILEYSKELDMTEWLSTTQHIVKQQFVIVPGVHQCNSVIHIPVAILFQIFFPLDCYKILRRVPVLYNGPLLVIHFKYSKVYMSIPHSLTIPSSSPSPLGTIDSFSKSLNLSVL